MMRRARGLVALLSSVLLGLALLAAAQPSAGRAPDSGTYRALAAQSGPGTLVPLLGKRWS
jgi:hypothetical protein